MYEQVLLQFHRTFEITDVLNHTHLSMKDEVYRGPSDDAARDLRSWTITIVEILVGHFDREELWAVYRDLFADMQNWSGRMIIFEASNCPI